MEKNQADHVVFNYNQIDDHIWIGTNQCCQMHFDKELLKKGISADVSLEKDRVDAPFGVDSYLWLPTEDHTAPSQDQLEVGSWHIKNLVDREQQVYVHCKNGHGRGPTMAAAYYVREGKTVEAAIEKIKTKRPEAHIEDVQKTALEVFAAGLSET